MQTMFIVLISLVVYIIVMYIFSDNKSLLVQRLEKINSDDVDYYVNAENSGKNFFERVIVRESEKMARKINKKFEKFKPDNIELQLLKAGSPYDLTPDKYIGIKLLTTAGLPLGWFIFEFVTSGFTTIPTISLVISGAMGYFAPSLWLNNIIKKRQEEIEKSLPAILDILTVCTNAGLTFQDAVIQVCSKYNGVLVEEFKQYLHDMKMGTPRKKALEKMEERCDVEDLSKVIKGILNAEEFGKSIAERLEIESETIRERLKSESQEIANAAASKLILPLALFILPAIFLILLGPSILKALGM